MAIYHASLKNFSRGKGESSLAAAAYRAGLDLIDTKSRDWHRYSRRRGVAAVHMLTPEGAPDWCSDPKTFWDANEAWETRKNALVARELEVSLPHELDSEQRQTLALALGQLLVGRYECVVMVAIHEPVGESDTRNHHAHLLMSARKVGPEGIGERAGSVFDARGGKGAEEIRIVRELVGSLVNEHLSLAGMDHSVDHRSLKDQAEAATARGDYKSAIRLTRPSEKHQGKVATALARKAEVQTESGEAQMDRAIAEASARGFLVSTPANSQMAAFSDRVAARRQSPIAGAAGPSHTPMPPVRSWRPSRAGEVSHTARRLSHLGRIARAQGRDAEVLNMEAELIEAWLAAQVEASESVLQSVENLPGIRLEPALLDAVGTLRVRRVDVYGTRPFFFEDTEALAWAIQNYGAELRRPYDNRQRLWHARAKLSEVENPAELGTKAEMLKARREVWKARRGVSRAAVIVGGRRLVQARELMIEARNGLERDFPITQPGEIDHSLAQSLPPEAGGQGESDLNERELKLRPPMRGFGP